MLVSRAFRLPDPHTYGSGNPGATNVLRTGKKAAALLTLLGDGGKGWVAVFLAVKFGTSYGLGEAGLAAVIVTVFLGHLFPVFFRFQGGKGVATALGVLLAIDPWLGLAVLATWLAVAALSRMSSLAAIVVALLAPAYQVLMLPAGPVTFAVGLMSLLLIWRHRANIRRILDGSEGRIGQKKAAT